MANLAKLASDRRLRWAALILILLGVVAAVAAWKSGVTRQDLKQGWQVGEGYLRAHPWALFAAMVVLPGLPFPASALAIMAGVVWRDQPWIACLVFMAALILNLTWTYWLAAGPCRTVVRKLLGMMSIQLPELPKGDHVKLILVMKLTPGLPLFFQNYMLGILHAPFRLYLPIGILCNGIIGCGIVLGGAGLSNGKLLPALTGLSLIVLGFVIIQLIRGWLGKIKAEKLKG